MLQLRSSVIPFGVLFSGVSVYPFYDCYLLRCLARVYAVLAKSITSVLQFLLPQLVF